MSASPADLTDRLGGLDQSRIGRDPGERHAASGAGARINSRTASGSIPPSGASGARTTSTPTSARERQIHDLVGGVVGAAGEDQVAAAEVERRECLGEGRWWSSAASRRCVRRPRSGDRRLRTRRGARPPARPRPRSRRSPAPARDAGARRRAPAAGCSAAPALLRWITPIAAGRVGAPASELRRVGGAAHATVPSISSMPRRHLRSRSCRAAARSPFRKASAIRLCCRVERLTRPPRWR